MIRSRHERRLPVIASADLEPPAVTPCTDAERPLISVMIPTYNCAEYLRTTLASVLAQDRGPAEMHIEVVDDCSNDDPEAVVTELGGGRVVFYRHPKNVGAIANFNTCVNRSRGHLVHILHGDDWVLPGFFDEIVSMTDAWPDAGLYATRVVATDGNAVDQWTSDRVPSAEFGRTTDAGFQSKSNTLQFAGVVARRASYESVGGFLPILVHTSDWEMWTRITERHGLCTSPKVLAAYRLSTTSDTSRLARTAGNVLDVDRFASVAQRLDYGLSIDQTLRGSRSVALIQERRFRASGNSDGARANFVYWARRSSLRELISRLAAAGRIRWPG